MKRFWTAAGIEPAEGGHGVALDGRPLRTPGRLPLVVPTLALAEGIAAEWNAVTETVNPRGMRLTGLANAAIEIVSPDRAPFAAELARYAESDLLCYRADHPAELVGRQVAAWEPALKAVEARFGLLFRRTAGVVYVAQPEPTVARVGALYAGLSPWVLAPLSPVVTITGSAVLGLALLHGLMQADAVFATATVDEDFQAEKWGEDAEAAATRAARRAEYDGAVHFLRLLGDAAALS